MRVFPVFGAAVVAMSIGGCGPRQGGNDQEANLAAAAADARAPAPADDGAAPPAAPRSPGPSSADRATTIPGAFLGVYDSSLPNCARPSPERLVITPGELRFHESIGEVRSVLPRGENEIEVDADYQGEGENWRSSRLLTLSQGGARLSIEGDGTHLLRVRCPTGAG